MGGWFADTVTFFAFPTLERTTPFNNPLLHSAENRMRRIHVKEKVYEKN